MQESSALCTYFHLQYFLTAGQLDWEGHWIHRKPGVSRQWKTIRGFSVWYWLCHRHFPLLCWLVWQDPWQYHPCRWGGPM